jgi:hypothetical protein
MQFVRRAMLRRASNGCDTRQDVRVHPRMFGEIHNFSGPFLGPHNAQENIFFA